MKKYEEYYEAIMKERKEPLVVCKQCGKKIDESNSKKFKGYAALCDECAEKTKYKEDFINEDARKDMIFVLKNVSDPARYKNKKVSWSRVREEFERLMTDVTHDKTPEEMAIQAIEKPYPPVRIKKSKGNIR